MAARSRLVCPQTHNAASYYSTLRQLRYFLTGLPAVAHASSQSLTALPEAHPRILPVVRFNATVPRAQDGQGQGRGPPQVNFSQNKPPTDRNVKLGYSRSCPRNREQEIIEMGNGNGNGGSAMR